MLYIKNTLQLDQLFDSFITKLQEPSVWVNPFNPPVVIFSDIKVEHWFKLQWINSSQNRVLMNLNTQKLMDFLFKSLAGGINKDKCKNIWFEPLTEDILRDRIIQLLINNEYYKTLNDTYVTNYIQDSATGNINEVRLYSFAKTIAGIFIEYLDSRNVDSSKGINAKWSNGESYFEDKNEEVKKLQNWQKKLYKDLFTQDGLTVTNPDSDYKAQYVTIAQLIEINRLSNDGNVIFDTLSDNIFIFGFSDIGLSYRSVLLELAKQPNKNLYVYMQAKDCVSPEASNPLLSKWNLSSYENLKLLKEAGYENLDNDNNTTQYPDTLLGNLQKQIYNDTVDKEVLYSKQKDGSLTIAAAPTTLREIEAVHSSICKIIKENQDNNIPVSYSDFVVLAPDVQEYRVSVMQVFDQIEKNKAHNYPYVSYVFSDYTAEYSAVAEAMQILVKIIDKKALYRADLFSLLRNSVISYVKGYSKEDISAWSNWVTSLNGYRDRINSSSEWKNLKKRLLVSLLTDNNVKVESTGDIYNPYSDMDSQNFDSLYKFVDAVDTLEDWIDSFANKTELTVEDIDKVAEFLAHWFKMDKEVPLILKDERNVYSEIKTELNNQRHQLKFGKGYKSVNAKTFFITLKDSASASKGSSLNLYTGGITFGNFALNRTIPAKYVYIIGLDSKAFPGTDRTQTLDLRSKFDRFEGDESIQARNKQAFLCQLMATSSKLYISYVNANLKKDEEFFRSSVLDDLIDYIKLPNQKRNQLETLISIDEKRNWSELYTKRELRNKSNFMTMQENKDDKAPDKANIGTEYPQRLSISAIKDFLKNPFVYQAKKVFGDTDDEKAEEEIMLYEPIELTRLEESKIIKEMVYKTLADKAYCRKTGNTSSFDLVTELSTTIEKLKNTKVLPDVIFGEQVVLNLYTKIIDLSTNISRDIDNNILEYVFTDNCNVNLSQTIEEKQVKWTLVGNRKSYYINTSNNEIKVFDFTSGKIRKEHYISSYITALSLIADGNYLTDVNVVINVYAFGKGAPTTKSFSIDTKNAILLLISIFNRMFDPKQKLNKYLSIENIDKKCEQFRVFVSDLENDYNWAYYDKKDLFNPYKDFGYSFNGFSDEYKEMVDSIKELVIIF